LLTILEGEHLPSALRLVATISSAFCQRRHAVLLAAASTGCSQIELGRLYFANNGTEARLSQALPITLPFREENGWIIVRTRVEGSEPVDFVVDTGASMLALLAGPKTDSLALDMGQVRRLGAADDLAAPTAAVQRDLDLDFGPLVLIDQTVLAIPAESLKCSAEIRDPPFQGVIGHELFSRFVVEINYDRGELVLHDPASYRYRGDGQVVPAEISGRQPFVQATVAASDGHSYPVRLHVDSGAGIDLSLFPQTSEAIVPPSGGETRNSCFVGGLAKYHTGSQVALAFGVRDSIDTAVDYSLGNEVIDSGQNGRIGSRFLRHYNVVFDYSRGQMILERRAETGVDAPIAASPDRR
jgi:hypothetical protein